MGACRFFGKPGWVVALLTAIILAGCGQAPLTGPIDLPGENGYRSGASRALWGLWEIIISPDGTVNVIDIRSGALHANVIDYLLPPNCADCLGVAITEFVPAEHRLGADITLKNPTLMTGFDVRGILISNVGHDLYNADDYTELWDDGSGIDVNPFKRYPADPGPYIFPSGGIETNHYSVKLPTPAQLTSIMMAVDASWPAECKEPFNLGGKGKDLFGMLNEDGGELNCYIDVFIHLGQIETVSIDLSPLGVGVVELTPWQGIPGLFNFYSAFGIPFSGISDGEYELWVKAKTELSNIWLYDKIHVQVLPNGDFIPKPIIMDVIDYPFTESSVAVKDGNLYALGGDGLKVYSIGSDGHPSLIGEAGAPQQETNRYHIYLDDTLAFAFFERWAPLESKIAVYDISQPSNPILRGVKEDLPVISSGTAKGDYLLCSVPGWMKIACIDATDPDNPYIGGSYTLMDVPYAVARDGDYLFVILEGRGIGIYGVTNPLSPTPVGIYYSNKVDAQSALTVADDKGYAWTNEGNLIIFSYQNPAYPAPISTTQLNPDWGGDQFDGFCIDGDFLYGWGETVYVIDVSDPYNPEVVFVPIVNELTPHTSQGMAFYGGFSYAPIDQKLEIIKSY